MDYINIKLSRETGVATVMLARPDALNALSPALLEELSDALSVVARDESLKALVLRGEGRAFCAGADLTYFDEAFKDPAHLPDYLQRINNTLFQLENLPIPVIAVVHGFALAGGLELMMACDMVLAADDARIGDQHVNFGLMPGGGSTQRLPRHVGMQRAMELLTTGRWLGGAEAVEWGWRCGPPLRRSWTASWKSCWPKFGPRAAPDWVGSSRSPTGARTCRSRMASPWNPWPSSNTWPPRPTRQRECGPVRKNGPSSFNPLALVAETKAASPMFADGDGRPLIKGIRL